MKKLIYIAIFFTSCTPKYYASQATIVFREGKPKIFITGVKTELRDTTLVGLIITKK